MVSVIQMLRNFQEGHIFNLTKWSSLIKGSLNTWTVKDSYIERSTRVVDLAPYRHRPLKTHTPLSDFHMEFLSITNDFMKFDS